MFKIHWGVMFLKCRGEFFFKFLCSLHCMFWKAGLHLFGEISLSFPLDGLPVIPSHWREKSCCIMQRDNLHHGGTVGKEMFHFIITQCSSLYLLHAFRGYIKMFSSKSWFCLATPTRSVYNFILRIRKYLNVKINKFC